MDGRNLRADFVGRFGGLRRKRFHFGGNDGKASSRLSRARRLDRGVQRQQVGLRGNLIDQRNDLTDLGGSGREPLAAFARCPSLAALSAT